MMFILEGTGGGMVDLVAYVRQRWRRSGTQVSALFSLSSSSGSVKRLVRLPGHSACPQVSNLPLEEREQIGFGIEFPGEELGQGNGVRKICYTGELDCGFSGLVEEGQLRQSHTGPYTVKISSWTVCAAMGYQGRCLRLHMGSVSCLSSLAV